MKLLFVPKAKKDENIFSFINRVAMDNMYEHSNWIYNKVGIKHYMGVRNILPGKFDISALCYLLNMAEDDIWSLTLHKEFEDESKNHYHLENIIYNYGLLGEGYKFCPHCLRKKGQSCKLWDIRIYTVCPIHRCRLVNFCPSCKREIKQVRKRLFECRCGYDLREIPTKSVDDKELYISFIMHKKYYRLRNKNYGNKNMLENINLKNMIILILFFLRLYLRDKSKSGHSKIPYDPNDEEYVSMLLKIKHIFENWPSNYFGFLYNYSQISKSKPKYDRGSYINTFGYFYKELYEKYNYPEFNFLRTAFEDYLHIYWGKSHLSNNKLIQYDNKKAKYISIPEAVNILKIKHASVSKLIDQGYLNIHQSTERGRKVILIERESVEYYYEHEKDLIDRNGVYTLLNISYASLLDLENRALLKKERGPEIDGSYKNKYRYSNVIKLLNCIKNKTKETDQLPENSQLMDLTSCPKLVVGISISDIITMVKKDTLLPIKIDNDKKGLKKFMFNIQDVKASVYEYKIKEKVGVLSILELSEYINVTKSQIHHYIKKDLLKTNSDMKKPFVSTKDAFEFKSAYINLENLSIEKLIPVKDLFNHFLKKGIYPKLDHYSYKYKVYNKSDIT